MTEATRFLKFISAPKDIYVVLDQFGYKIGSLLIKRTIEKGYAEKRDYKIILTKIGQEKLRELELLSNQPIVQIPQQSMVPEEVVVKEQKNNSVIWILGIVGFLGAVLSVWKVVSMNSFMPFGLIGIISGILLIIAIFLASDKGNEEF